MYSFWRKWWNVNIVVYGKSNSRMQLTMLPEKESVHFQKYLYEHTIHTRKKTQNVLVVFMVKIKL